jgi:phosphatidylserine decarboxylase
MAKNLEDWAKETSEAFNPVSERLMSEVLFFRDPYRSRIMDSSVLYSPADGVLLYLSEVSADGSIEFKGKHHKISEIVDEELEEKSYFVAGIFMTYYDVHINRMPTNGIVYYRALPSILSYNAPMLMTENDILKDIVNFKYSGYEVYNARFVNTVFCPVLGFKYYVVQIADDEVNTITPFSTKQNAYFHQNERFSFLRSGSQVDLIIPASKVKPLIKNGVHVEAGIDALFEILSMSDKIELGDIQNGTKEPEYG